MLVAICIGAGVVLESHRVENFHRTRKGCKVMLDKALVAKWKKRRKFPFTISSRYTFVDTRGDFTIVSIWRDPVLLFGGFLASQGDNMRLGLGVTKKCPGDKHDHERAITIATWRALDDWLKP